MSSLLWVERKVSSDELKFTLSADIGETLTTYETTFVFVYWRPLIFKVVLVSQVIELSSVSAEWRSYEVNENLSSAHLSHTCVCFQAMEVERWTTVAYFEVREHKESSSLWTTIYKRWRHSIESHLVMTRESFFASRLQVLVKRRILINFNLCLNIAARRMPRCLMTIVFFQDAEIDFVVFESGIVFGRLVLLLTEEEDLAITISKSAALEKVGLVS